MTGIIIIAILIHIIIVTMTITTNPFSLLPPYLSSSSSPSFDWQYGRVSLTGRSGLPVKAHRQHTGFVRRPSETGISYWDLQRFWQSTATRDEGFYWDSLEVKWQQSNSGARQQHHDCNVFLNSALWADIWEVTRVSFLHFFGTPCPWQPQERNFKFAVVHFLGYEETNASHAT